MSAVDEVKQRLDITEVVGETVRLQKSGRNFKANCPFHTERTPSFYVFPDRQSWHCFGACGTGGDVITFVMKKDNLEFPVALRLLAERAGVTIDRQVDPQQESRRDRLRQVNEATAVFYASALLQSDAAAPARAYAERRGLGEQGIRAFQLGYAPEGWDSLRQHLHSRSFSDDELIEAGVVSPGERGPHDRFRHRLIFPIRDERGRVVGFGGRSLPGPDGEANPKYLNTAQTPLFDKGALLFAIDLAKDEIRRQGMAVVVEGYMDAIAAHEKGFSNVVASMGTALTDRQVHLLKRYTKNLALALDADAAGNEATLRGVQVMAGAVDRLLVPVPNWRGLVQFQETLSADIKVISLPEGRDPDEVIREDPETWRRLVQEARPVIEYLFTAITDRLDLSQPRERSKAVESLLPIVSSLSDRVVQAHYLQRLARIAQVSERTIQEQLPKANRRPSEAAQRTATSERRDAREEFLLALLFKYPELRPQGVRVAPELLNLPENQALLTAWKEHGDEETFDSALDDLLKEQYQRIVAKALPPYPTEAVRAVMDDCLSGLSRRILEKEKYAHQQLIAEQEQLLGATRIAEAARAVWQSGPQPDAEDGEDAVSAAALFVEDMNTGLQLHRKQLDNES